jgi:hypothetical protein
MQEATENIARLRDLEVEDFERICEFAYRGNYRAPRVHNLVRLIKLRHELDSTEYSGFMYGSEDYDYKTGVEGIRHHIAQRELRVLTTHFSTKEYEQATMLHDCFTPCTNISSSQNFGPVFMTYARIYAFAEQYMAKSLKQLILSKLHKTLLGFTLYRSCRPAVMDLLRFAYDNDYIPDRGIKGERDQLREMIVPHMAMHTHEFRHDKGHRQFLNKEGEYAGDLLEALQNWRL